MLPDCTWDITEDVSTDDVKRPSTDYGEVDPFHDTTICLCQLGDAMFIDGSLGEGCRVKNITSKNGRRKWNVVSWTEFVSIACVGA